MPISSSFGQSFRAPSTDMLELIPSSPVGSSSLKVRRCVNSPLSYPSFITYAMVLFEALPMPHIIGTNSAPVMYSLAGSTVQLYHQPQPRASIFSALSSFAFSVLLYLDTQTPFLAAEQEASA